MRDFTDVAMCRRFFDQLESLVERQPPSDNGRRLMTHAWLVRPVSRGLLAM